MDKNSKRLGWGVLIAGAGLSIAANIRSLWLPARVGDADAAALTAWRQSPQVDPSDPGAFAIAILLPIAAVVGIEMVVRWKHLPSLLRFGVLGVATAAAILASFTHIMEVALWYRQSMLVSVLLPFVIDGLMLLASVALFIPAPVSKVLDKVEASTGVVLDKLMDIPTPDMSTVSGADIGQSDNLPDMSGADSLDTDNLPPAPMDIVDVVRTSDTPDTIVVPAPRRKRADPAWKAVAVRIRTEDPSLSDSEVAAKVLAEMPGTWANLEAGRKAVSRLS